MFPDDGYTKGDVVGYYAQVGDRMLPFVEGRALTVERYPKGLSGKGFMQKNAPDHYPDDLISRHEVPRDGGTTVYPVIASVEGILFFANLGVLTFHVPSARAVTPEQPDWLIWDLDPPEGAYDLVRTAALALRELLEQHHIPTFLMTSGSNGYHLRARVSPGIDWHGASLATRGLAALAQDAHPDLLTLAFRRAERGGRVFVDWLRNAPYSTSVVPWSLRAKPGAPVATPIRWEEIGDVEPDGIRIGQAVDRMEDDPWASMTPIDASAAVEAVQEELKSAGIELESFDRFRS